jgi:hypothetical protein
LAPATFGASLLPGMLTGSVAGAALGAAAGDKLVDGPQELASKGLTAQQRETEMARESANKQASAADQAFNKANGKSPDISSMLSENVLNAKGGQSGTMLTGSSGVDPSTLLLGRKTLLGG